jgi:hypothetical protein
LTELVMIRTFRHLAHRTGGAVGGTIPPPTQLPLFEGLDINRSGEILGSSIGSEVSIWEAGQVRSLSLPYGGDATALNDHGDVVGWSTGPCCHSPEQGFYLDHDGTSVTVGNRALALNNHSFVVGTSGYFDEGPPVPSVAWAAWPGGSIFDLAACCTDSAAVAVNDAGVVVINGDGRVFTWHDGVTQPVSGLDYGSAINAGSAIAGTSGGHAAVWRRGRVHDLGVLPGASDSAATAIDVFGNVFGTSPNPTATSFFWSRRTGMLPLPDPPGFSCQATGMNAGRQIVGTCYSPDAPYSPMYAVLWDASAVASRGASRVDWRDAVARVLSKRRTPL